MPRTDTTDLTRNFYGLPVELTKVRIKELTRLASENFNEEIKLFQAMSDIVRIKVLEALKGGELCVCVLIKLSSLKPSTFSYHLSRLSDSGLVKSRREASYQIYSLTQKEELVLNLINELRK